MRLIRFLITALVASLFAASVAGAATTPASIKACANKKSGALRLLSKGKCKKKKESALTLSVTGRNGGAGPAGPAGPQGAPGAQGPQGAQGATGTPDTSNFFTKTESDARYLLTSGTASNANALGGFSAQFFTRGVFEGSQANAGSQSFQFLTFGHRSLPAGSGFIDLASAPGMGSLQASCSDPAQTSVRWRNGLTLTQDVWIDDGSANPVYTFVNGPGGTAPAGLVSGSNQTERIVYQVGQGSTDAGTGGVATYVVTVVNAPGAQNRCVVTAQGMVQTQN